MPRAWLIAVGFTAAIALPASVVLAQQYPPAGPRPAQAPAAKSVAPPSAGRDVAPAPDSGLQRRVEQLEEQLVDMQVMVGTLESLAKGGATAAAPALGAPAAALSANDAGRLDALETQIRAMAAQLENLQDQVRNLADRGGGGAPGGGGFGAVTIAPAAPRDDADGAFPGARPGPAASRIAAPAAASPPVDDIPPQQLFERAYGYLLQKDYSTAEAAFDDFLKRNPGHALAGNAQYWLGETFYVRGQYRPAATAYLKGYQDYSKSQKASESLLKLAMSLDRLGQKDEACTAYREFADKFPNAPAHIKARAQTERQRSNC